MSDFPTANFSGTDDGLFTVDEIQRLMAAEFDRALRYRYPLVYMAIGVDRLDHLKDLYGYESKGIIVQSVTELLRTVSRSSDFLGCLVDDRVLTMFPNTDPAGAAAVARRLLRGARELKFDGDGHTLQVTLSVGASHNQSLAPHSYEDLVRTAEEALVEARAGGGDRYVVREPALLEPPAVQPSAPPPPAAGAGSALGGEDIALFDRIREYLVLHGDLPGSGAQNLEKEILASVLKTLRQERDAARDTAGGVDYAKQIELLERRIAKLSSSLSNTEAVLRKVAAQRPGEDGLPSVYREVQGLAEEDLNADLKRELMARIFQANLDLQVRSDG